MDVVSALELGEPKPETGENCVLDCMSTGFIAGDGAGDNRGERRGVVARSRETVGVRIPERPDEETMNGRYQLNEVIEFRKIQTDGHLELFDWGMSARLLAWAYWDPRIL